MEIAKKDPAANILVLCDDADVFGLLLHFYKAEQLDKNPEIVPTVLALHALTGCDSVASTYGIGKATAISVAKKGFRLDKLVRESFAIPDIVEQASAFMGACFG